MKKITILFTLFIAIAAFTTSCNKKKIEELESELAAAKTQQEAANNATNSNVDVINGMLNSNHPINIQTTGNRQSDSVAFSYNSSFSWMDGELYYNNSVWENEDDTYGM